VTHNCLQIKADNLYSSSSYTFNFSCGNGGLFQITGFGFPINTVSDATNTNLCLTNTNDMSLDQGYCGSILLNWFQTSVDAICAKGVSSCSPQIDTSYLKTNCPQNSISSNMYLSYSCYGK